MPVTRNYNPGSIIYFQEDKGDEVFVLQKGSVVMISPILGEKIEKRQEVKVGEFFGVKSGLGRYLREETAQAVTQSTLVVFKVDEFEKYAMGNPGLLLKMLRVFSNELREIHRRVRSILNIDTEKNPAYELLGVGESFYKSHNLEHASYAFNCYLRSHPNGKNRRRVEELLDMIKQDKVYPSAYPHPEPEDGMDVSTEESSDSTKQSGESDATGDTAPSQIKALFDKAEASLAENQLDDALAKLKECTEKHKPETKEEKKWYEHAQYKIGIVLVQKKEISASIVCFSQYIRSNPQGEFLRHSLFQLGILEEAQGKLDHARNIYHKVATMRPHDDITMQARKRLQEQ